MNSPFEIAAPNSNSWANPCINTLTGVKPVDYCGTRLTGQSGSLFRIKTKIVVNSNHKLTEEYSVFDCLTQKETWTNWLKWLISNFEIRSVFFHTGCDGIVSHIGGGTHTHSLEEGRGRARDWLLRKLKCGIKKTHAKSIPPTENVRGFSLLVVRVCFYWHKIRYKSYYFKINYVLLIESQPIGVSLFLIQTLSTICVRGHSPSLVQGFASNWQFHWTRFIEVFSDVSVVIYQQTWIIQRAKSKTSYNIVFAWKCDFPYLSFKRFVCKCPTPHVRYYMSKCGTQTRNRKMSHCRKT